MKNLSAQGTINMQETASPSPPTRLKDEHLQRPGRQQRLRKGEPHIHGHPRQQKASDG